ncbi:hypothetical protein LTR36_008626 [Oleoguttula mirabilis]|uniref:AB hydrolase-1 domain-containing protein n=1 Tax=Oleoguttula mirabilis TaxID=1507867 RepID=A0AAV9JT74_9PEZI|nr:hypothetical protein LTR36_008626 [Oleoguttula mirabilis]
MTTTKPAIVLVPGAWHTSIHFRPLTSRLEKAGYEIHALDLPSTADNPGNDAWKDDIALIRGTVEQLADRGRDVVLVMHSRGGLPGSDAAEGMSKADRSKEGKQGGIVRMLYMCAFAAPEGVSLFDATHGPTDWLEMDGDLCRPLRVEEIFYGDLSAEMVEEQKKHLKTMPTSDFSDHHVKYAAWKHIPSTYLVCEKDNAIGLSAQEGMIAQPDAKFTVERCGSSHSPYLSMPDFTAEVVRRAAGEQV